MRRFLLGLGILLLPATTWGDFRLESPPKRFDNPRYFYVGTFGTSVAMDFGRILVGDPTAEHPTVGKAGAAYLFGNDGTLIHTFENPLTTAAPHNLDGFGVSVAFAPAGILVGAESSNPDGVGQSGSAYLFRDEAPYDLLHEFVSPALGSFPQPFGEHLGISVGSVGGHLLIGAFGADDPVLGVSNGAVYLFRGSPPYDLLHTFFTPTPSSGSDFGYAVAGVSGNVLIGAPRDSASGVSDAGGAYLFEGTPPYDLLSDFFDPAPQTDDLFGWSVAGVGEDVVIRAPYDDRGPLDVTAIDAGAAFLFQGTPPYAMKAVFRKPSGAADQDWFGYSVAGFTGKTVLIGAIRDDIGGDGDGAVYWFDGANGDLIFTFTDPNPHPLSTGEFGFSLATLGCSFLSGARGNSGAGDAYLFGDLCRPAPFPVLTGRGLFALLALFLATGFLLLRRRRAHAAG